VEVPVVPVEVLVVPVEVPVVPVEVPKPQPVAPKPLPVAPRPKPGIPRPQPVAATQVVNVKSTSSLLLKNLPAVTRNNADRAAAAALIARFKKN
jgi:hypothetical protein